jgi:hypothetical protein
LTTVAAFASLFGVAPHDLYRPGGVEPRALVFDSKPTARTKVAFEVAMPSVHGTQVVETATVGRVLGLKQAEIDAMTHAEVEAALEQAHREWVGELVESGWGPA